MSGVSHLGGSAGGCRTTHHGAVGAVGPVSVAGRMAAAVPVAPALPGAEVVPA